MLLPIQSTFFFFFFFFSFFLFSFLILIIPIHFYHYHLPYPRTYHSHHPPPQPSPPPFLDTNTMPTLTINLIWTRIVCNNGKESKGRGLKREIEVMRFGKQSNCRRCWIIAGLYICVLKLTPIFILSLLYFLSLLYNFSSHSFSHLPLPS